MSGHPILPLEQSDQHHQDMSDSEWAPRRLRDADVVALIGLLAVLEGELMLAIDLNDDIPDWAQHLAARLTKDGLLTSEPSNRDLRQALNDLNQRLRYAHGEYAEPPQSTPVP
jgi:hypothetical protein